MGLFQNKQHAKKKSHVDEAAALAASVFDEQYREELHTSGREFFKQVIDESATVFKQELDATISQVSQEIKAYMTKQLDATITQVNATMTKQLDERLVEYDRVTKDAQDQAVQSLNRNAQILHDKYQQLSTTLQQVVASQEAMMIGVFEENKARMTTTQNAQDTIVRSLRDSAETSQQQSQQLNVALQKTITDQEALLTNVFQENMARVNTTKDAQDVALQSLNQSAQALQQQHQQLRVTLQQTVANQESILVDVFENNMAQIIEHYLLGALGDQFDMKAQLPLIIQQMETNKQAIVDDMKL